MMSRHLSRRAVLRGAFGATMSLPLLEIMLERRAAAATPPRRYLVAFGGYSLGADGDKRHDDFVPDTDGPGYDPLRKSAIAPLAKDSLAKEITIVSGLRVPREGDAGYEASKYHGGNHSPLLCGIRSMGDAAGQARIMGVTSDQVVADAISAGATFRSLHYCVQAKGYSGGPAYGATISMRKTVGPAGETLQRMQPVTSPQQAYQTLFFNFQKPDDAAALKAFEVEKKMRVSVLDACGAARARLAARLGRGDQQILEQYYEHCREIEARIAKMPIAAGGSCAGVPDPGADPPLGGDTFSSMQNMGKAPEGTGWSNETLRAKLFCDLVHMAFTCDLTRVATLTFTRNQCFMSAREIAGYGVDVHSLGHRIGGSPSTTLALSKAIAWHMGHFGYLVAKLRDTRDGTGASVLDSSALVMLNEGGHGPNPEEAKQFGAPDLISNGSSHSMENMACAIAGGAGGLKRGHHVRATGKHPVNVLVSLMNAVGVAQNQLGNVTGAVRELFAR